MSQADEIAKATRLFENFHGTDAKEGDIKIITVPGPQVCLVVGEVESLVYRRPKGDRYRHKFAAQGMPVLVVTADGSQSFLLGGDYQFKDDGFNE